MLEQQPVWRQNRRKRLKPADGTLALKRDGHWGVVESDLTQVF